MAQWLDATQDGCVFVKKDKIHIKMKNSLQHPLAENLDLDSPEAPLIHRQIINSKPFLQNIYQEWYQEIIRYLPDHSERRVLELGSGGGHLQ